MHCLAHIGGEGRGEEIPFLTHLREDGGSTQAWAQQLGRGTRLRLLQSALLTAAEREYQPVRP